MPFIWLLRLRLWCNYSMTSEEHIYVSLSKAQSSILILIWRLLYLIYRILMVGLSLLILSLLLPAGSCQPLSEVCDQPGQVTDLKIKHSILAFETIILLGQLHYLLPIAF